MEELRRSTRDPEVVRRAIEAWLAERVHDPHVAPLQATSESGMSSETVLFDATWDGEVHPLVMRMAPSEDDVPVFPVYDLAKQAEILRLVRDLSEVPVPEVVGVGELAGSPFFVMERVEGVVPPDVMPYTFGDNWLFEASAEDQRLLQETSVALLVTLHALPVERFDFLDHGGNARTPLRRHLEHTRNWYEFVVAGGERSPLVDSSLEWLGSNCPDTDDRALSWGDARIGNVLYQDFEPVAVLDWEMAGVGPRELDVAWMVMAHMVFERIAKSLELPGMPSFMREEDVVATYQSLAGEELAPLGFDLAYAAVQWAIVFIRTGQRRVHFGEQPPPQNIDDQLYHRDLLEELVSA